jgi:hypothetical protein
VAETRQRCLGELISEDASTEHNRKEKAEADLGMPVVGAINCACGKGELVGSDGCCVCGSVQSPHPLAWHVLECHQFNAMKYTMT